MPKIKDANIYLKTRNYSKDEMNEMLKEYYNTHDPELKNKLIETSVKLVLHCAKDFSKMTNHSGLDDLISAGYEALGQIIDTYDPSVGSFSTYACEAIRRQMQKELRIINNQIYIPANINRDIIKINKLIREYKEKYGIVPTAELLSQKTGFKLKKIKLLLDIIERKEVSLYDIDFEVPEMEKDLLVDEAEQRIRYFMDKCLTDRERTVINLKYGFNGEEPKTYKDIGKILGVTGEWVRQIEKSALRKLRGPIKQLGYFQRDKVPTFSNMKEYDKDTIVQKKIYDDIPAYQRDYEGWTEEEYEKNGMGFK